MTIKLRPATDSDIREFSAWNHDPPYDVYDIALSDGEAVIYFQDPEIHCYTILDGPNVAGYCTFGKDAQVPGGDYGEEGLDIGLGIEPARTGSGEGYRYVAAVVAHALATFEPRRFRVSIAVGNKRAIRVWSGAGFTEISRFVTPRHVMGSAEFVILALEPTATGRA